LSVNMLRCNFPMFNPKHGGRCVGVLDAELVEEVYRQEGKYPDRGEGLKVFKMLRERRPGKNKSHLSF